MQTYDGNGGATIPQMRYFLAETEILGENLLFAFGELFL
ncbi:MAG: hypothetical protein JWQ38_2007 [Flavipsychrobacter sp.]|nr:hypothetical protein [Flavipsychrobacter sp.]